MKNLSLTASMIALASAVVAAAPAVANACAMCGLSPGDSAGHAYNTSVLFMLVGPYFTLAAIGGIVFIAYRRSLRRDAAPSIVKR